MFPLLMVINSNILLTFQMVSSNYLQNQHHFIRKTELKADPSWPTLPHSLTVYQFHRRNQLNSYFLYYHKGHIIICLSFLFSSTELLVTKCLSCFQMVKIICLSGAALLRNSLIVLRVVVDCINYYLGVSNILAKTLTKMQYSVAKLVRFLIHFNSMFACLQRKEKAYH